MCFPSRGVSWAAVLTVAALSWVVDSPAQEPAQNGETAARAIREQNVYIPYEKLRQVFEKHGRGVFLPYEKFQELWQAAQDKTRPATEPKPPVGALITEIENEATVERDVVRVRAKLSIEVLAEGWSEIPLRLSDAAIISATLGGQPARIVGSPGREYRLLVEKKGKPAESMTLALEYAKAIARSPGRNSVSFQVPQAAVSRWRVTIPQSGVKVNLHPFIAAAEAPSERKPGDTDKPAEETVVLAFVGAAPEVRIDWTPKAEGASGLAAVATVQAEEQIWIGESTVRARATLTYAVSRAELGQLTIDVPGDYKVVNVFDPNIRQWSIETAEGRRRIAAQLFEPAKTAQQVVVELEKYIHVVRPPSAVVGDPAQSGAAVQVDVPVVSAVGAGREQGVVVIQMAEGLRTETAKTAGLMQIDAKELPPALQRGNWAFAYRYAATPFELALAVEKVQPSITVDSLCEALLEPNRLSLDLAAVYSIEKAGVFRLELDVPAGYEVREVRGAALAGAAPVRVDAHRLEGPDKTRLSVNLSQKALGRVGLIVRLQKELNHPELLTPGEKAARLAVPIPVAAPGTVQQASGRLVVHAPEGLRVNPAATSGLRSVSFKEAYENAQPARAEKPAGLRPLLAYAFAQEPVELTLDAQRRKPQVTVRQLIEARWEEGVLKYRTTLFTNVLYSGVKSLRLDVPAEVAADLRVITPGIREKPLDPPPDDLAKDCVAWSISGESEMLGDGQIELLWEKKLDRLDIGKPVESLLPYLKPREVDRAWGQIALVKSETIDVQPVGEPAGLRPIDPQHDLMKPVASAARAFEFHGDWTLKLSATRYQLEEVKRTSIERAVVRMVVTPAESISVQALYRMKSARQRLEVKLPEGAAFDAQPLRIDGRPAPLERGQGSGYYVPLTGMSDEQSFVMELRYTLPGDGRRLDLPEFPEEPAAVKAFLCLYVPETRTLLGARGPWTQDFHWRLGPSLAWRADPPNDAHLVEWVRQGAAPSSAAFEDFPTDGRLYVYSTLGPAPAPKGSLETILVEDRLLRGAVFALTVLLGLLLLPARLPVRAFVVGLALAGLVLSGAFLPTFLMQILNGTLAAALGIVAILWTVAALMRRRGRVMPAASGLEPVSRREQGIDLTRYRPETPDGSSPVQDQPKPAEGEGGQDHA